MFTRRKQDSVCLQGGSFVRPLPTNKTCDCTAADVECDYGYVTASGGTCTPLPQVRLPHTGCRAALSATGEGVVCCSWPVCTDWIPPAGACGNATEQTQPKRQPQKL